MAVLAGALAVAVSIALLLRRRQSRGAVRSVDARGLHPGVYFFSSDTCDTCDRARETLDVSVGRDGYTEFVWEHDPDVFGDLGVDAVPAVAIVDREETGRLYPGQPDEVLGAL